MEVLDEPVLEVLEEPVIVRHRLTVDDYGRMFDIGVLPPDKRFELIDGEVIDMAAIGSRHFAAVIRLSRLLHDAVGDSAIVSTQAPVQLSRFNAPEPDLALLKPRDDFYASALPTGADTLMVIEVADTTLPYDVRTKAPLYALHGVPEYWVIDLAGGLLRRFRAPQADGWTDVTATPRPGVVELPGLPGASIDLSPLF